MKHVVRPAARDDILRQFRYYLSEDAQGAAMRFLDGVEESIRSLCRMPEAGSPRRVRNPVLQGLRTWAVQGFEDIRIYYLIEDKKVRVIRVLHGRRDIARILEQEREI